MKTNLRQFPRPNGLPLRRPVTVLAAAALAAGLTLASCSSDSASTTVATADSTLATETSAPAETTPAVASTEVVAETTAAAAETSAVASGSTGSYPLTVKVCGREWTYKQAPTKVIASDTGMLDLMLALGLHDNVTGWFGSGIEKLDPAYSVKAADLKLLGKSFPYPTLESILAAKPDMVLSYGYNTEAGFTPERLQQEGINNFTPTEGCDNFSGASTLDTFYDDVRTLASIFDVKAKGEELITSWKGRIDAVKASPGTAVKVLNTGSGDPAKPFASAGNSLASDLIRAAGGTDIFQETKKAFFEPTWEEVVSQDPDLIIESSGGGDEALAVVVAYLNGNPAFASMSAVKNDKFVSLRYTEAVPGTQIFNGVEKIAAKIAEIRG